MPAGWKKVKARVKAANAVVEDHRRNLLKARRSRNGLSMAKDAHYYEVEIDKAEKVQKTAAKAMKLAITRSFEVERRKMSLLPKKVPAVEVNVEGEMDLMGGMQFFARLIDILDPDVKATARMEREALVQKPLRMTRKDTKRIGEWFWASLGWDCAEEVIYAIEEREMGITISRGWINRKRRMAYGGVQMEKRRWGRGKFKAKFGRLRGRGLYTPPTWEMKRTAFLEGTREHALQLLKVRMKRPGQATTIKAIKPDHPLIWTGTLISNIEGWSDYSERAAYYGVRRKGEIHPYPPSGPNRKDIVEIAQYLVNRYNFLGRPAVKKRVREAAYNRIIEMINMLVG